MCRLLAIFWGITCVFAFSEIEKFDLSDRKYFKDFSHWVNEIKKNEGHAKTLIIHSDAPVSTSLLRPRRIASPNGRFFIAKVVKKDGTQEVEFISWNSQTHRNDFGTIKNFGTANVEIQPADRKQCLECHKTSSAILMKGPWITSTGANSPTAALQSFALLSYLDAEAYKKFKTQSDFGDISPALSLILKDYNIDGIPIFDFKGAEILDENVVRNYLLTLTYEIQRKLDETQKQTFAEEITEQAWRAVLLPKEIEYAWNWYPFLTKYLNSELKGQKLLNGVGPLRKNYFPAFENIEITKNLSRPPSSYGPDAIDNFLEADRLIEKSDMDVFPSEASAKNIEVFEPLVSRFRSDTATETLKTLFDLETRDIKRAKSYFNEDEEQLDILFSSFEWKNLFLTGDIPSGEKIQSLFEKFSKRDKNSTQMFFSANHRCLSCHNNTGSAPAMPLDPLRPELWEERLKEAAIENEKKELLRWIKKIPDRLNKPEGDKLKMPPTNDSDFNYKGIADRFERIRK